MKNASCHKSFRLNGKLFSSVEELIIYSEKLSKPIHKFLKEWFNEEDFVIVQTSGSTGKPKQIHLKKEFMKNSALATGEFFNLKEGTRALLCLSADYIAGKMMLIRALTLGWELDVIPVNSFPLRGIKKQYDFSAFVPMQLQNSLAELSLIKKLIVGGGVVSKKLESKLENLSTEVFATYGMTETITHIAVKRLNKLEGVRKVFYEILPNVTIYIDRRNCLVIKAPKVSSELIITNDVVELISDSQFEWLGRFDNVINSGGVKLFPEKIEERLSKIISERFFVVGTPDDRLGEKLVLVIEILNSELTKDVFFSRIRDLKSLSKYETPKEIHFIDQFIETETNKIQRNRTLEKIFTN